MAQAVAVALKALNQLAFAGAAVAGGAFVADKCILDVDGGERAVIFNRFKGLLPISKGEGSHFIIPFVEEPTIIDVRTKAHEIPCSTGTKDLQTVNIRLRVMSRPDVNHLPTIYKELGTEYNERILPSIGNEVLKGVVAQFNADQLLTSREKVSRQISEELSARAAQFNLQLDDVAITHLTYGKEFTEAVEQKQVAFQEAERSKFVVMKAEQERQAAIIRAEGESEAAKLVSDAVAKSGSGFIEVQRIDAAKEIAEALSRSRNVSYLPNSNGGGILLGLNTE
ncbi:prohibitin-1, mitochondrial-like [Achlya hypogyna]|uniref:Prohibitin n=1 Tax=Achlya hypogyna TaxID=1202772 RepID=A0A1V9ZKW0_ACHHY|nr:prohibitin-1, mitochondrial-like [Achlya hypogyna]